MRERLRSWLRRAAGALPPPRPPPPSRALPPPTPRAPVDPQTVVFAYHAETKHHPGRYARALPFLDWDSQPDPFRTYTGAPQLPLDLIPAGPEPHYEPAFCRGRLPVAPLDRAAISQLFQDSLGLSAWKVAEGNRWSLRVNPSSGNLHPTEGYLIAGPIPGLAELPAVYHYQPYSHALERRAELSRSAWEALVATLPEASVLVGLSTIALRESWKYGERAYRYCHHDVGHAIGALCLAAAGLGWEARLLEGATEEDLRALLGLADATGPEAERPDLLLAVFPQSRPFSSEAWRAWSVPPAASTAARAALWFGQPTPLATDHHPWPAIEAVASAARRLAAPPDALWDRPPSGLPPLEIGDSALALRPLLHQRRSAVEMDGRSGLTREAFFQILRKVLPGDTQLPFPALPWTPKIDLIFFVHRVADLRPGLYALVRSGARAPALREAMDPSFLWQRSEGDPPGLFLLQPGDARNEAAGASCGQAIAADGCFAVAMLAEFRISIEALGPSFYPRLHWEAGLIGQVLYLEAEASGVRATGIGCFFDDVTHRLLGLRADHFQVIYHFTVGGPVDDPRLQTQPPYAHLSRTNLPG